MKECSVKIGIMGGTFNPIHYGHLMAAEDVREKLSLDRVLFIPSGQPPHKPGHEVIEAEHRYEMVRLAVQSNPMFEASRIEIDRKGTTYTVNTLQTLQEEYGNNVSLNFIIGADVIPELVTWREFRKVFQLCDFIAVLRPGYDGTVFEAGVARLKAEYDIRIQSIQARQIDISSTEIRNRCQKGETIKYLLPENVEAYILEHDLYRTPSAG